MFHTLTVIIWAVLPVTLIVIAVGVVLSVLLRRRLQLQHERLQNVQSDREEDEDNDDEENILQGHDVEGNE